MRFFFLFAFLSRPWVGGWGGGLEGGVRETGNAPAAVTACTSKPVSTRPAARPVSGAKPTDSPDVLVASAVKVRMLLLKEEPGPRPSLAAFPIQFLQNKSTIAI